MELIARLTSLVTGASPPVQNMAKGVPPKAEPAHLPAPSSIGTGAVNKAQQPQPQKPAPNLDHLPHCSDRTVAAIAAMAGFRVPKSTRDKIAEVQKGYDVAFRNMVDLADGGARKLFQKQQAELQEMARAGKDISNVDLWDLNELEKEAREKLMFFKKTMRECSEAAYEIVKPHIAEFSKLANELADRIDADHAQTCAALCLHEVPSYPALMVRKAARQVERANEYPGTNSPDQICNFIPA